MQAENICFFCTACKSKSNMAQNKSRNTQITYLNIAGQRWNHNAQKQDRYRRDWTHLPGSPCAPTVNNLYPECYTCTGDVRHSRKARQVLETTRECVPEAPHGFCSACFVTRARLKVLQPDWLSLSSGNVGLWVRGVAALLLAAPPSPCTAPVSRRDVRACRDLRCTSRERAPPQLRGSLGHTVWNRWSAKIKNKFGDERK